MRVGRPLEMRLAIAALAALVAIVAVLGTWQVWAARSSQRSEIRAGELNSAHLASSALGSALESRLELLNNLAGDAGLASVFTSETALEQNKVAATLHILYPGFASFDIIGAGGRVDARWPEDPASVGRNISSQGFFAQVVRSGKPYVSQGLQQSAPPRELVAVLAAPVRDKTGKLVGLLAASIPGPSLGSLIGGTRLRDGGGLIVFDQDGHALTGPAASATRSFATLPAIAQALQGHTGSANQLVPGYRGQRMLAYAPVASTGWAVVVQEPASVLNGPIAALTERLVAIGLAVLLLAAGTVVLVGSLLRRVARERQRAGALVSSVGEGVATIDDDGVVQQANPALERLTGRPSADLVGKPWSEAFPLYGQRGDLLAWDECIASAAIKQSRVLATAGYGLHLAHSDGQRVPVSITAAPLLAGEESQGAVVVVRDVSREREVDQLKSSLVSTVSHELRTPLTMIQGFSELLLSRDGLGEKRSREALEQILASAQRLGRLIDDLLSVSRIDSGKLRVDLAAVDIGTVVAEVVKVVSAQASEQAADRLVVELALELPPVLADRDKLVQVLMNLVSNALKYSTSPLPVTVRAEAKQGYAEISVSDQGIGMTEEECAQVFEKFSRADRPEVRRVSGTGLGLYITKSLVEMQHGQVWVKSQPGVGSVFSMSLPLSPPPVSASEPALRATEEAR